MWHSLNVSTPHEPYANQGTHYVYRYNGKDIQCISLNGTTCITANGISEASNLRDGLNAPGVGTPPYLLNTWDIKPHVCTSDDKDSNCNIIKAFENGDYQVIMASGVKG
jgi:hypothetical protein